MAELLNKLKGDRTLWVVAILLALISMFPVYSASSNIAFLYRNGNTSFMLFIHFMHLSLGIIFMYFTHRLDYGYFAGLSKLLLPLVVLLLAYTLMQGVNVSNASRWIRIPFTGLTFQSSALAWVVLPIYQARYLTRASAEELKSFTASFWPLVFPLLLICGLILPSNFSTAALIFCSSILLMFIGGYAIKNILILLGSGIAILGLFILLVLAFPNISNRVETWQHRIEHFAQPGEQENYQVHKAKMAIAEGQLVGKGPGKSLQKNFLPQSNSDFIYAIIVEEFGLAGGLGIVFLYLIILVRILMIATKASSKFGSLITLGVGLGILMQAFTNLGVAVNLLPVTGQTLPLISAGGTSIWMTCIALGIILSVSCGRKTGTKEMVQEETEAPDPAENNPKTPAHA